MFLSMMVWLYKENHGAEVVFEDDDHLPEKKNHVLGNL